MIVIPSVSIGNVPQLAIDLLIHTYDFKLVKSLDDSALCPFIGPLDHVEGSESSLGISTAAQLYKLNSHFLVQIRSPPLLGKKRQLIECLLRELPEAEDVLVVGSANAAYSHETDLSKQSAIVEVDSPCKLPDSGFVEDVLKVVSKSRALVAWVYEGDNTRDSQLMAEAIASKMELPTVSKFKTPVSWSRVYGSDAPLSVEEGLYN